MRYEKIMKQLKSFNFTDAQRKKLASIILKLDKEKQDILISGDNIATINGQSLLNGGNISLIKTGIFSIVTELPTNDIDKDKVYLVPSTETDNENKFSEYIYTDNGWEKLGTFTAEIDLSPYAKALNLPRYVYADSSNGDLLLNTRRYKGRLYLMYSSMDLVNDNLYHYTLEIPYVENDFAGLMPPSDKVKLDGIEADAQVNKIESVSVNGTPLEITNKGVNILNATTEKDGTMSKEDKAKLDSQPTIKASNVTGVTDNDYVVIKKSELNSILSRLSALENKA